MPRVLPPPALRTRVLATLFVALSAPWFCHGADSFLWREFREARLSGTQATLPDFSYAGYDYSESPLPDTSSWPVFDVTDYGASPDDGNYDDAGIQAAIDAAQAAGGGIVFFPPGRFMVSFDNDITKTIRISSSNMLLKGSGSGPGGTEIFMDKMKVNNGRYMFEVKPLNTGQSTLTTVTADAPRGSYEIEVANAVNLWPGRRIILRDNSIPYAHAYYAPLELSPTWTRLVETTGFNIRELHTVASVEGNTVRLREPLHLPMIMGEGITIQVRSYNVITDVGIEDILFKGNWDSYPESFVHHKDDIHDYAWNALRFDNVANGWLRDCEFKDWNQCVYFDGCAAFTVENVHFTGKMGHMSIHTRRSYGILIKDCVDSAGHWHGPGVGYWGCGTVYLRHQMAGNQRIDAHSGSPYATLMDGVTGGHFDGNGGPLVSYPHHGRHFVAWNFTVSGGPNSYTFWPSNRNGHTFAKPIFAGLQGKSIAMSGHKINESPGMVVQPASLFEAQLQLRLGPTARTDPASAVDRNSATLRGTLLSSGQAETTIRIYRGQTDGGTDPDAWDGFEDLGTSAAGPFSFAVSGLVTGSPYHYRVRATNAYYDVWAEETESFIPGAIVLEIPVETERGARYRIQRSSDLVEWAPDGEEFFGTGERMVPRRSFFGGGSTFYRAARSTADRLIFLNAFDDLTAFTLIAPAESTGQDGVVLVDATTTPANRAGAGTGMRFYSYSNTVNLRAFQEFAFPGGFKFEVSFYNNNSTTTTPTEGPRLRFGNTGALLQTQANAAFEILFRKDDTLGASFAGGTTNTPVTPATPHVLTLYVNAQTTGQITYAGSASSRTLNPMSYDAYVNGVLIGTTENGMPFMNGAGYDPALGIGRFGWNISSTHIGGDYTFDDLSIKRLESPPEP